MPLDAEGTWVGTADNPVFYDSAELRRADATLFAGSGAAGLGVKGGIIPHGPLSANVTLNGDAVTVEPFAVALPGATPDGGVYRTAFPTAYTQTLTRDATYTRIDRIVARMLDADVIGSHGARRARLEIIPGVPASAPSVPTMPSMAIEVARLTVPAVGAGAITINRLFAEYACAPGGVLLVPTSARLGTSAPHGQEAYILDAKRKVRWTGSEWRPTDATGGYSSVTADVNGVVKLPHGLGAVPKGFTATPVSPSYFIAPDTPADWTDTVVSFRVKRRSDGGTYTGGIAIVWTAIP